MAKQKARKEKIYCSLDIETSDFDPSTGEVLEVGFVMFQIEGARIKIIEEWESTFKPYKEVPARILALTGISTEELDESPRFAEKKDEIQEKIGDAVIVGHNVNFDMKFLEAFGIKFSGSVIDTLDLAQIFLPTASSYNLEGIMGQLNVSHKDAHRALADCKAALVVMEKLLGHYASFKKELKKELVSLYSKSKSEIKDLLSVDLEADPIILKFKDIELKSSAEIAKSLGKNNAIVTFPLGFEYQNYVYGSLQKLKEKIFLVVPNKKNLLALWRKKAVFPIFDNGDLFNEEKFKKNLEGKLSDDLRLFFAKILVWKNTNWQSSSLVDLNLTFFGNYYRSLINYEQGEQAAFKIPSKEKILATDYDNFISLGADKDFSGRKLIIFEINNFESALTMATSKKASWGDFIYALKQVYDPESGIGRKALAKEIKQALSDTDLFFGLASMNFTKINSTEPNILVDKAAYARPEFEAVLKASENFISKISKLNERMKSDKIEKHLQCLKSFFVEDEETVRWVEIYENRLAFFVSPIDLRKSAGKILGFYKNMLFTASLGSDSLIGYFVGRLNLQGFSTVNIGQQELRKKIEVFMAPELSLPEKIMDLLGESRFPAALLLPNAKSLKEFYEANFKELQKKSKIYAQGYSGGANKLIENFSNNGDGLFIGTDRFVLKQSSRRLKVKTLIITRLPFEQFKHPLFVAQAQRYANQFVDFNIPRALYNFHSLIRFFYGPDLEKIYILDQKIRKDYGKYFIEYMNSLPFVEIKG